MGYYDEVYSKRLNRYGNDYQTRLQGQRERVFEDLLLKSVYRVDFLYNGTTVAGILEKYKQDETRTLQYLLTRVDVDIPSGNILRIPNKNYVKGEELTDENSNYWLVYYLEEIKASGYNRYIMLKATHLLTWKSNADGLTYTTRGYFYGQENNMLRDELKSRSRFDTLYNEDLKTSFFIIPANAHIHKDDYFEMTVTTLTNDEITRAYRVTGFDVISTPGIEYVTVDPIYIKGQEHISADDKIKGSADNPDTFWLQGGN